MSVKIQILNEKDVKKLLKVFKDKTMEDSGTGINKAALFMQSEVKNSIAGRREEATSVDTGRFLNSVDIIPGELQALVFTDIEYAKFLEYGTSKLAPRRHFTNSLIRNKKNVTEIVKEAVQK